jgi:hypothetical protein
VVAVVFGAGLGVPRQRPPVGEACCCAEVMRLSGWS